MGTQYSVFYQDGSAVRTFVCQARDDDQAAARLLARRRARILCVQAGVAKSRHSEPSSPFEVGDRVHLKAAMDDTAVSPQAYRVMEVLDADTVLITDGNGHHHRVTVDELV